MTFKRLWYTFRLYTISGSKARADYIRNKKIYAGIGENCTIMKRKIPLYANLIKLGNNVHLASNVSFLTHDISHIVLNNCPELSSSGSFQERVGCIEIGNNVFIGSGVKILYDTKIGNNVIIGTGSIITKDIPDNSVVAGVPARVIGTFDDYAEKMAVEQYPENMKPAGQVISPELAEYLWKEFDNKH